MKRICSILLCAVIMLAFCCPAFAAESDADIQTAAAYLREQGVMIGDQNGDMHLEDGLNRAELATLLTRLEGVSDSEAEMYAWACYFTDVPNWAKKYVGFCRAMLLVNGYGNSIYGADDPVIPNAACTVVLRSCGYEQTEDTDWSYNTAADYAAGLGWISRSTADAQVITRGEVAVLIYRALHPEPEQPKTQMEAITIAADGTITEKTIVQEDFWREDFSQQANPVIFGGSFTRGWYNTFRQSMVDKEIILAGSDEEDFNPKYLYAHTITSLGGDQKFDDFNDIVSALYGGYYFYDRGTEPYVTNQYEYPGYTTIDVRRVPAYEPALAWIQPRLDEWANLSDREKVEAFNDLICDLIVYDDSSVATVSRVFSAHEEPVGGVCAGYATAFTFLCGAADIPCVVVSSDDHAWNEVYVDGRWYVVDTTWNDNSYDRSIYLLIDSHREIDEAPQATQFAKELLVPGSTK